MTVTGKNEDQQLTVHVGKAPWPGQFLNPMQADGIRTALLLILLLLCLTNQPPALLSLALCILLITTWNVLFAHTIQTSVLFSVLLTSFLITLLLPQSTSYWVLALCVSFGVVFGEQIYGGRAHSFLSPVIVTLAFLFFAFPIDSAPLIDSLNSAWLLIPFLILLLYQQLDWLTLLGTCLGMLILYTINQGSNIAIESLVILLSELPTSIGLLAIFILGDTVLTARTPFGKLLSGILAGVLFMHVSSATSHYESAIFSLLLAWITIPLIDWLVLASVPRKHQTASEGAIGE